MGPAHIRYCLHLLLFSYTIFPFSLSLPRAHFDSSVLTRLSGARLAAGRRLGVAIPIGIKLKLNVWQPFIFPDDRASRRGCVLYPLSCFLLFPCTLEVFTALGSVPHSPPVCCDASSSSDASSSITSHSARNLVLATSQGVTDLG